MSNNQEVVDTGKTEQATRSALTLPPSLPDDRRFRTHLEELASAITPEELKVMKIMFMGPGGLPKRTCEACKTCLEFFRELEERMYISSKNCIYLISILHRLKRQDLIDSTLRYCREVKEIIYYYPVPEETVKYNVICNSKHMAPESVHQLRERVAMILCASPEVVVIKDVESESN